VRELANIAKLSDPELGHFQDLVRHFLGGRCFVRKEGSKEERWRYILRHQALLSAYFAAAGWDFEIREDLGAAMARPTHRRHAHLFSALQTHFVYHLLALHYEATTGTDLDRTVVSVTFGDLMERVNATLPPGVKVNRTGLEKAWRKLADFGAVTLSGAFSGDPTDVITIHPVIEMVLDPGVIEAQLRALQGAEAGDPNGAGPDGEGSGDGDDDDADPEALLEADHA
jgi:hypothetical protein